MLYSFVWVIPRHLNFLRQHFGKHCPIFIGGELTPRMKMEQTKCSEMSAHKIQLPGNPPKERKQHTKHRKSLKSGKISSHCILCWTASLHHIRAS